jgi:hypothetical protein
MTEDNLAIIKVGDEDRVAHDFEGAVLGEQESLAGDEGNFRMAGGRSCIRNVTVRETSVSMMVTESAKRPAAASCWGSSRLPKRRKRNSVGVKVGIVNNGWFSWWGMVVA